MSHLIKIYTVLQIQLFSSLVLKELTLSGNTNFLSVLKLEIIFISSAADALTGLKDYSLKVKHTGVIRYQFPSVIK